MANQNKRIRYRGYDAEVETDDDGNMNVIIDNRPVPIRNVDGKFVITYFQPQDDEIAAIKHYIDRLARK